MKEKIRMDSHKLIYHPETVSRWLKGECIYPIEIEISPSGACNHRCTFCAVDYLGYNGSFLNKDIILRDLEELSKKGLKSVICSGEGEPLLNKDLAEIVKKTKDFGIDVAMSSNAVFFTKSFAEYCLELFTWVRFSVASFEEESYNLIQRGKPGDLRKVKENLLDIIEVKRKKNLKTTIGVQCILLPDNIDQLPVMADELRNIGVDYLTIKPYSQHLHSNNKFNIDYNKLLGLEKILESYQTENFSIIYRSGSMKKMHKKKEYSKCLGLPFMTHIDSFGNVWPCVAHIGSKEFCYGNIYENSFVEIWEGEQRRKVVEKIYSMDINQICRDSCRLDEINKYLDELYHPCEHVNFI